MGRVSQPAGTVTLVFTDIEGSTRLLGELGPDGYRAALGEHRRAVREALGSFEGYEVDTTGDAFFYAFASAPDAVAAVDRAMQALEHGPIRIRVGLHTGSPDLDGRRYIGLDVHKAARIMAAGHGGQVLLSRSTRELLDKPAPLRDLGDHRLKDFDQSERLFQLGEAVFPPLRTISNTNLPRPASAFVGRESELAELTALFETRARLVTLTGPGGTGKTRLAIEVASGLLDVFRGGLFWVELAALRDPSHVLPEVSRVLGARDDLAEHIGERELLLVIDNLEQVTGPSSGGWPWIVSTLMTLRAPRPRCSRRPASWQTRRRSRTPAIWLPPSAIDGAIIKLRESSSSSRSHSRGGSAILTESFARSGGSAGMSSSQGTTAVPARPS
jgi:class 3 adenylate cyclase